MTIFRVDTAYYPIVNFGMAIMTDLCHLPAHELVRLMSSGRVSCRDVIEAHGGAGGRDGGIEASRINDFSHMMVHNLTGWPAAVIRCGTSAEGLPVGVHIVARPWRDATALAVAGHLEKVFDGWRPPSIVTAVA